MFSFWALTPAIDPRHCFHDRSAIVSQWPILPWVFDLHRP
jgi:hypothetical protein